MEDINAHLKTIPLEIYEAAKELRDALAGLNIPFVSVFPSKSLGYSIQATISLEFQHTWHYGILENSNYISAIIIPSSSEMYPEINKETLYDVVFCSLGRNFSKYPRNRKKMTSDKAIQYFVNQIKKVGNL